jgi:N5-(cytidine 5'-diphosphoramidyl)-L-glutamine hydrolase
MRKILITQRRDKIQNRDETRDCLDVRWGKILYDLNLLPIPVCSELTNAPEYIAKLKPDGILLSGGNDLGKAPKRDKIEFELLEYAVLNNTPVLAVCRGMQVLNSYFGGTLVNVKGHVATYTKLQGNWAKTRGYEEVNSFHNEAIIECTIAESLEPLAITADGVIKAVKHPVLPWLGIMWHPERESVLNENDKKLILTHFNNLRV